MCIYGERVKTFPNCRKMLLSFHYFALDKYHHTEKDEKLACPVGNPL